MFHKATHLEFKEGTNIEVTFRDGKVVLYDMASLFGKYPQLKALEDRNLFTSGRLMGAYGIVWNDDLDIELETVYEDGTVIREECPSPSAQAGEAMAAARALKGMTQKELSAATGIDQSDLSKIERGAANPSIGTLQRIAAALGTTVRVSFEPVNKKEAEYPA